MNTRLQVEHPITELVTGVDLVQWQIRIARGERARRSIPTRCSAARPRDRVPHLRRGSGNRLHAVSRAHHGACGRRRARVRDDSGVDAGAEVPIFYDPLISKLVAWGDDRPQAIARMRARAGRVRGRRHQDNACRSSGGCSRSRTFVDGAVRHDVSRRGARRARGEPFCDAGRDERRARGNCRGSRARCGLRPAARRRTPRPRQSDLGVVAGCEGAALTSRVRRSSVGGRIRARQCRAAATDRLLVGRGRRPAARGRRCTGGPMPGRWSLRFDGRHDELRGARSTAASLARAATAPWTALPCRCGLSSAAQASTRVASADGGCGHGHGPQRIVAPMPGKIVKVLVKPGDTVAARQGLVVVEAMKMENELRAPRPAPSPKCASTEGRVGRGRCRHTGGHDGSRCSPSRTDAHRFSEPLTTATRRIAPSSLAARRFAHRASFWPWRS